MNRQTGLQKVMHFFLVKIIVGIAVVGGLVAFTEWSGRLLLEKALLTDDLKNAIIAISDITLALMGYIFLYRFYEKRQISELSLSSVLKYSLIGFSIGFILQFLFILVIYISGCYSVTGFNSILFLVPSFNTAITAGFVSEIIIRGIVFRLIEERSGTSVALIILTLLFVILHLKVQGATPVSVLSTAIQAGFVLSSAYVYTRSLWFTIFMHFAWDFSEPGIFGAINPGNSITESLIACKISGPAILTGGQLGPQNSIQALLICLITGSIFLYLAKNKNSFIKPYWKR